MPEHIYALLVGIGDYPVSVPPVPILKGPHNDIQAMEAFLIARTAEAEEKLHLRVLYDQQATKQALLSAWQEHLCQAGPDDVALFMFCGHGSRVPKGKGAEEGYQESLVCWDSRLQEGVDLQDTELAGLIRRLTAKCPHLILLLDCCHSGSAHRSVRTPRLAPPDLRRAVSPSSALQEVHTPHPFPVTRSLLSAEKRETDASGGYILLAACQEQQLALEAEEGVDGQVHGLFSAALLEVLRQTPAEITYGELYQRVLARIRARTAMQTPRFESSLPEGMQRLFLGRSLRPRPITFRVSFDPDEEWILEAGLLQGIPVSGVGAARLALFAPESTEEQILRREGSLGTAMLATVMPQRCCVLPDAAVALDPNSVYRALFLEMPQEALRLYLEGDPDGVAALQSALQCAHGQARFTAREVSRREQADFVLQAAPPLFVLQTPESLPLCRIQGSHGEAAQQALERLERIRRWRHLARLNNESPSALLPDAVILGVSAVSGGRWEAEAETSLEKRAEGEAQLPGPIEVHYWNGSGRWQRPSLTLRLTNRMPYRLYAVLLGLAEDYAVVNLLPGGCVLLPMQRTQTFTIGTEVPEELWRQGISRTTDILKLLVCRSPFDAYTLEQSPLPLVSQSQAVTRGGEEGRLSGFPATLRNLRGAGGSTAESDWMAAEVCVTTLRSQRPPAG